MDEQYAKYTAHRNSAKQRGVDFDLSFDEWKEVWSGKFHMRGPRANQLGMLRTRDEGGYSFGNVRIGSPKENRQEAEVARRVKNAAKAFLPDSSSSALPASNNWLCSRGRVFDEYTEDE